MTPNPFMGTSSLMVASYPPLPLLPPLLQDVIDELQQHVQAPVEMIRSSVLAVASAACQTGFDLALFSHRERRPIGLFFLTLGESGERKTSVDRLLMVPLLEFDARVREEGNRVHEAKLVEIELLKEKRSQLRFDLRLSGRDVTHSLEFRELLATEKILKREVTQFRTPAFIFQDATPEGLIASLPPGDPCGFIATSEGSEFLNGRITSFPALLNKCWDGDKVLVARKSSPSIDLYGVRLASHVMVQPGMFQRFLEAKGDQARSSGFFARCLIAYPFSTQGQRLNFASGTSAGGQALDRFHQRLRKVLHLPRAHGRQILRLSSPALQVWNQFREEAEISLGPMGKWSDCRDMGSKIGENAARIAAVVHVLTDDDAEVGPDAMRAGIAIARYHADQFVSAFRVVKIDPTLEQEIKFWSLKQAVIETLRGHMMQARGAQKSVTISRRFIAASLPKEMCQKTSLERMLLDLVNAGVLKEKNNAYTAFEINPFALLSPIGQVPVNHIQAGSTLNRI